MTPGATDLAAPPEPPADRGFTLVELLVSMGLFAVLGSVLLGFVLSTADVTDDVSETADVTGEARLALERMNRELRQARSIEAASISDNVVSLTFWTDFDGDDTKDTGLADPEVLTYRWDRAGGTLTLSAPTAGTTVTRPVLAAKVASFDLRLRSSLWQYDGADGTAPDGETTWQELDRAGPPVGDRDGVPDVELEHVDLVAVRLRLQVQGATREFVMQADLRNQET